MTYLEYLQKIEKYVEKSFQDVIIISQVIIPDNRFESILKNFKKILNPYSRNQGKIIDNMWKIAPKTCLYLTVTYAIYHYDGNFWSKFKEEISLLNEHIWKRNFLNQLKVENLVVFDKESGQKYINNILGHASLPKHNVKNFITNVLTKSVEYNLEPEEIVAAFNRNSNGNVRTYGIYKSVQDFIKLNNHVSNDVLSRCLEVWREHNTPFSTNYRYFLPDHILQEFDRFVEGNDSGYRSKTTFIKRPLLMYSPENQYVYIHLPVQRFPINRYQELKWVIKVDENEKVINTYRSKSIENNEIEFNTSIVNREFVVKPNSEYEVIVLADNEIKGEWVFNLPQVIFFNSKTLTQERKEMIPNKDLIAVTHDDLIHVIEEGKNQSFIKPLFNLWAGYYEAEIFVKEQDALIFPQQTIYLNPDQIKFDLIGDICANIKGDYSLFSNMPTVNVNNQGKETDLKKWMMRLTHNWTNRSVTVPVKELVGQVPNPSDQLSFSLSPLIESLGISFGKFTLSVTGNLGQDHRMEFILLSKDEFLININDAINDKKLIKIKTAENLDFASETEVNIQKSNDNLWQISLNSSQPRMKGIVLNKANFEAINITIYSTDVVAELKNTENKYFPLGELFNKTNFNLNGSYVLLDLENPNVSANKEFITAYLNEPLRSGEMAQKAFKLKTGRKHLLGFDYFEGIHDTNRTRTFFLDIPERSYRQSLLTIETYWKVNQIDFRETEKGFAIDWDVSFAPESLHIRIWQLNQFDRPYFQKVVQGTNCSIEVNNVPRGYFLVELLEHQPEDFFASLFNKNFPLVITDRTKVCSHFQSLNGNYSLARWLLVEDFDGEEYERSIEDIEKLLKSIYKNQNILLPLLLEDYDSCCDFGIQNIDELLEIIESNSDDYEYHQFIYKLIGFQEWDMKSFQNVIQTHLLEPHTGIRGLYAPSNLSKLYTLSKRELFLSNQRRKFNEQLIKGFSLEHAFIMHLHDIAEIEYREKINSFLVEEFGRIKGLKKALFEKRMIPMEFDITLNERKITNVGFIKNFPYIIGITACFTASLLYCENELTEEQRISIRNLSHWMLQEHQQWFLYDLIYWKNRFFENDNKQKDFLERKKRYEHPSFAWKN